MFRVSKLTNVILVKNVLGENIKFPSHIITFFMKTSKPTNVNLVKQALDIFHSQVNFLHELPRMSLAIWRCCVISSNDDMLLHLGEPMYRCIYCDEMCETQSSLDSHINAVHLFLEFYQLNVILLWIVCNKSIHFFFCPDLTINSQQFKTLFKHVAWRIKIFRFSKWHS